MAIIYSYPETTQILLTDMLIGTSTIRVAGKKKNLTKNFTIETLGGFIHDNFPTQWGEITGILSNQTDLQVALDSKQSNITLTTIGTSGPSTFIDSVLNIPNYTGGIPTKTSDLINDGEDGIHPFITAEDIPPSASTLNDVLTNGNISLLDANIGGLGLYDLEGSAYSTLTTFDHNFIFTDYSGNTAISFEQGNLNINKSNSIAVSLSANLLTVSRGYYLPDAAGTIALTSDIPSLTGYALESWVTSNFYPLTGNPSGFITSSALTPYLLSTTAASTYYPIPTGTISQYIRGDGTFATLPSLTGYVPYTGATSDVDLGLFDITASHLIKDGGVSTQFLKADGSVDNNIYLTSADLPATLDLFATTYASDIPGYSVLVRNITDSRFNTVAVDVSTGVITTTAQLVGSLISDANTISGNPGIFNITTIGNISRTSGTGQAEFFFRVYKRDNLGIETFITESSKTLPVTNGGYVEFSAAALWNDGVFLNTDRIVLKYYADRLTSPVGSNPTYKFQFGGISPVRSTAAVPVAVLPNIYLSDLADVEDAPALNNEILYWNDTANLWEHSSVIGLLSPASSTINGYLTSTDWTTFNAKQDALTNPITGTGTTNYLPKFTGTSTLGDSAAQDNGTSIIIEKAISNNSAAPLMTRNLTPYSAPNYNQFSQIWLNSGGGIMAYLRNDGTFLTSNNVKSNYHQGAIAGSASAPVFFAGSGGLFFPSSTDIAFTTASTERMRINAAGNVGIGTTAPLYKLQVYGGIRNVIPNSNGITAAAGAKDAVVFSKASNENNNFYAGNHFGGFLGIGYTTDGFSTYAQILKLHADYVTIGAGTNNITYFNGQAAFGITAPVASAKVQIDSTTQGFLPPRMTNAQRLLIATPAVGLCVYCTDAVEGLYINKSTGWTYIG